MTTPAPRLPVEPLLKMSGMSARAFCDLIGKSTAQLSAWRRAGGLTPSMADDLAAKIHLSPGYIWPDLWYSLPEGSCGRDGRVRPRTEEQRQRDIDRARERRARIRQERQGVAA
jgi:hypothetical protein